MRVLVLNAGSSTLKWTVLEDRDRATLASGIETWKGPEIAGRVDQVRAVLTGMAAFDCVGHRIVHGGARFTAPMILDRANRVALDDLSELDPLHMRPAVAAIDAVTAAAPSVRQVCSFDTAFHARMPEAAAGYALPFEWSERWNLRRFGFHGLSVRYAVERARELLGAPPRRLIVCHLGSGCSVTAVANGVSIDTTMGFTPLDGVMMATRSGSVDPGLLLYLQLRCGIDAAELRDALESRSGLLGVSGISGDVRTVIAAADAGSERAQLAYDRFVLGLRRAIGAMTGVLGGVDAIVYTGGIGEHSARVREAASIALRFAGLEIDGKTNQESATDRTISTAASVVSAHVIHAREDLVILDDVITTLDLNVS